MLLQEPASSQEDSLLEAPRWIAQERTSESHIASASQFAEAAEPHIPLMLRAARGILGSEDLAWDAVQETLLRVWTKGWIHEAPAKALVHLAVKSSLHLLRCQRRRSDHEARKQETFAPCCDEDPLLALESDELAHLVQEAIKGLAVEYRTVLELYEFGGLSYDDIAGRLDLPIGTVRSRISRARALLHERLGAYFHVAWRPLEGADLTFRRVQFGALPNDDQDLFVPEGTVADQVTLMRALVPDDPDLHEAQAGILYLNGDHDAALAELEIAERLRGPSDEPSRVAYHRGLVAEAKGDHEAARELNRGSSVEDPSYEPALRRLLWLEANEGMEVSGRGEPVAWPFRIP